MIRDFRLFTFRTGWRYESRWECHQRPKIIRQQRTRADAQGHISAKHSFLHIYLVAPPQGTVPKFTILRSYVTSLTVLVVPNESLATIARNQIESNLTSFFGTPRRKWNLCDYDLFARILRFRCSGNLRLVDLRASQIRRRWLSRSLSKSWRDFGGITPTVKRIVVPFQKTIDEPVTRDVKMTVFSCGLSNEPRSKLPTRWQITSSAIANGEWKLMWFFSLLFFPGEFKRTEKVAHAEPRSDVITSPGWVVKVYNRTIMENFCCDDSR